MTMPQRFNCWTDSTFNGEPIKTPALSCSVNDICQNRSNSAYHFELDTQNEKYLNNWIATTELMCAPPLLVSLVGSSYFIGVIFGIFMFRMPNTLGRKKTMKIVMPIYFVCSAFTVFAQSPVLKALGYFAQGLLHIKIPLSFTHLFELNPEEKKGLCSIFINTFDNLTLAYCSCIILFISRDADRILKVVFAFQAVMLGLYLAIAPESPTWCLLNHRFEEAVENINYIAKFNGKQPVLSLNSKIQMLG